jgi:uncharacterized protein YndB with AHSA1/START domain
VLADFQIVADRASSTIVITRSFAAPRALVFDAWTKAEHVKHWWDPSGATLSVCEIDLRIGGSFRWVNRDDAGHAFSGTYTEIAPPERLAFTARTGSIPDETMGTLIFGETASGTRLTMTITCASIEHRNLLLEMRVDAGTAQTLANLAAYLESR